MEKLYALIRMKNGKEYLMRVPESYDWKLPLYSMIIISIIMGLGFWLIPKTL